MKTIEIYTIDELDEETRTQICHEHRDIIPTEHIWHEASGSVKEFVKRFSLDTGRSWLDFRTGRYDQNVLNLKGMRLRTWIINNHWNDLHEGKYYSTSGEYIDGKYHYTHRHSNIIPERTCSLTGVCYDINLLDPFWKYLDCDEDYFGYDLESLFHFSSENLRRAVLSEEEYYRSEEAILEHLQVDKVHFTKDGKRV